MTSEIVRERDLAACEQIIDRGLTTFIEVGQALLRIRDERLYRDGHDTFEDYCRERWSMSRKRAYDFVAAAEVTAELSPIGDTQPPNEAVARELAPLRDEPDMLREAWTETVERHGPAPTAAQTREVVREINPKLAVHFSTGEDAWETPQDFFDTLDAEFGFELDVCALPTSAKCARYFTPETDAFAHDWRGACWMNPPYSEIGRWIERADQAARDGATVVALIPARTDTAWWWEHCRHHEIRFVRGRLKFGGSPNSAPFPSAVVVFGRPARVVWWNHNCQEAIRDAA